jgi:gamma-glutamyl phosphate reductase
MQLETIRGEIERMRAQLARQRKEILALQRAGIATASADALLQRMLDRIDGLCIERDRLKKAQPPAESKVLGGRNW